MKVLYKVKESRNLITIIRRRVKLIGHLLRYNDFVSSINEGKVLGKRGWGMPKKPYLQDIVWKSGSMGMGYGTE